MGFFVGFSNHFMAPVPPLRRGLGALLEGGGGSFHVHHILGVFPGLSLAAGNESCLCSWRGLQVWGTCEQAVKVPLESHHHPIWQWV